MKREKTSSQLLILKNNAINTFIEYLLDTQTTSDVSFNEAIARNETLYHRRYLSVYQRILDQKFQQWKEYYHNEHSIMAKRIILCGENESSEESSIDDAGEEEDRQPTKSIDHSKDQVQHFNH